MKQPELSEKIRLVIQYMQFVPLIIGNKIIFFIILNAFIIILLIFIIILSILNIKDKSKVTNYNKYIDFLKICMQLICFTFFGQIFGLLIVIFICENNNKTSLIDKSMSCRTGSLFYAESVMCIICLVLMVYYSYASISVYYKPNFIFEESDILKKTNSIPDLILLLNKIIFIISIFSTRSTQSYQWLILFILFWSTLSHTLSLYYYNNYENKLLMKLHKGLSLIVHWNIVSLIIGKIFQKWEFNGTLHLFLFGTFIIIISLLYHKEKINEFYILDFEQIDSGQGKLKYIRNFFNLIQKKDKCRESFIIFNNLILLKEENCINKNCKIKKYLKLSEKGLQSDFILYQYCQQLFEMAIKQFPDDIILKSNYIIFLVVLMSKKKLAQNILSTMIKKPFNFQNNYIIYCCKKYIDEYNPSIKKNFEEQNKNIMVSVEYEKIFNIFKDNLSKTSSLYYEFWSSLYKSHLQGTEDFIKLNNIGERINSLIDLIEENFNKLYRVKNDDIKVLNLYIGFLKNVLNNKNKYNEYKNIITSLSNVDKIQDKEIDYSNFDLKTLNNSDEYKYIIISAEEENLGIILNLSLNICQIFGYNKNELIGKNINILIPEIFHKQFEVFLIQTTNNIKTKFYETLSYKKEYYPEFIELFIHGRSKSKYLVPLYIKFYFAQTEESEHIYIIHLILEDCFTINKTKNNFSLNRLNTINTTKEVRSYNYCCVLTDYYFNIQSFTPNCQELLGLNSDTLNANIDITKFIEQFKEELDKMILEESNEYSKYEKSEINLINPGEAFKSHLNSTYKSTYVRNNISNDKRIGFKRYIAENKFNELQLISWKIYDLIQLLIGSQNNNNNSNCTLSNRSIKSKKSYKQNDIIFFKNNIYYGNTKERSFLLIIKKIEFFGKNIGYKFFFKREKMKCIDKEVDLNQEKNDLNIEKKRSKKINVSFKTIESNDTSEIKEEINEKEEKSKLFKMSKSFKNKGEENILELIEEKSQNNNNSQNNPIERKCSSPLRKNILKKRPSKFLSLNITNNNIINNLKNQLIIEPSFIPDSNFNFVIDLDSKSYKPSFKSNNSEQTTNFLKGEALTIIKKFQMIKNNEKKPKIGFTSFSSSNDESELYEEEEDDEDSSSDDSISITNSNQKKQVKIITPKKNDEKGKDIKKIELEIEGHFYRINGLNKIKFMIYDFDQEMIIDKGINKDIKSEIENVVMNYKLKIPIGMDKDSTDPSLKVQKFLSKYSKNKDIKKEKSENRGSSISLGVNIPKKINKEQEVYKRIENSLNKNDREKSIMIFYFLTLFSNIILIGIACFALYFILTFLDVIKNNLLLVIYSTNIRYYTNIGVYYVREMIVLTMNISNIYYVNYPLSNNRTIYIKNVTEKLKKVYFNGHNNMELMMGMNLDLTTYNTYYLTKKPFKTEINYDAFKRRIVTSSLSVSIVQIYSFFNNLIITENFDYTSLELFNFFYNALNDVGIGIENLIKIYLDEVIIRKKNIIIMLITDCAIFLIIYIIIYFLIIIYYLKIIQRKENYISVFYEININFIRSSMIKCERFIAKINPNELLIAQEKNNNDNFDETLSFYSLEDDFLLKDDIKKNNNKYNKTNNNQNGIKIKYKEITKTRAFKIQFFIFLLFSYIYIFFALFNFIKVINTVEIMGYYLYHMQHFHNNLLNLFNAYREFIFFSDSTMYNYPVFDFLNQAEKGIYETFDEDINYLAENCTKINGLNKIFIGIQQNHLCNNSGGEILNLELCNSYVEIITSLGFYSFVCFWIEEIRIRRNYVLLLEEINKFTNMWNGNFQIRSISLYNSQSIHPDINFMFNYIILSYINEERDLTENLIISSINSNHYIYKILLILYIFLVLLFYILYWRPILNNIKILIYKTKNMLTIIPVEILATQTNIKSLLNISDLND